MPHIVEQGVAWCYTGEYILRPVILESRLCMYDFVFQIVCAFLVAMSLIFIIIEARSHFDKSFFILGFLNIFLFFFCAIDIWIQPDRPTIFWTRVQHIIASFFPAVFMWYLMIVVRRKNFKSIKIMFFIGSCFAFLFFTNIMFRASGREITSTLTYNLTFAPYMLVAIASILIFLIKNLFRSEAKERKVLFYHVIGSIALAVGGILDMVNVFIGHRLVSQLASFTTPGLLLFGMIVTIVFIDRLTTIIKDREITFGKLQAAYQEMEEVQSLKELGQSTAFINHEIKNFSFAIAGSAQLLLNHGEMNEYSTTMVSTIADAAKKMGEFSRQILDFSRAKIASDKRPLEMYSLIKSCVETNFPHKRDAVAIEDPGHELRIHGDCNKLEHVFVNIFKNAFEAGAARVSIKAFRRDGVLLIAIEDDGEGCTADQLEKLFKSFYTTKKRNGGTGLGMCIMRSIIEGHGGSINAYSKNVLNDGTHGMVLNIVFPSYNEEMPKATVRKDAVVLIKDSIENLVSVIRIFQNVVITPSIVQRVDDLDLKKLPMENPAVYASRHSMQEFKKTFPNYRGGRHALVSGAKNVVLAADETKERALGVFSEQYLLENL